MAEREGAEMKTHKDIVIERMAKAIQMIEHNEWHTWETCHQGARNRAIKQAEMCYEILLKNKEEQGVVMNQWISVKDRLPEHQAYAGSDMFAHVLVVVTGMVFAGMYCNGKFEIAGVKDINQKLFTHWMPYPDPPDSGV